MTMKYILAASMRALVLTPVLLASPGFYPAFAQDGGRPPARASQPAPAQTKQNPTPQRNLQDGRDLKKTDSRDVGRENDMGRMMEQRDWDHRKAGRDWRMRP